MSASTKDFFKDHSFTLLELLIVLTVVSVALAVLIPALSPNAGRAIEGDVRNFGTHLEYARSYAISKRTKTRVLIAATNDWGTDFSWRTFVVASLDSTTGNWLQLGKFTRLSQSTTFDSATGVVAARSTTITPLVKTPNATPTPAPSPFTGAFVEFSPAGCTSLDPNALPEAIRIQDGFVPSAGIAPTPMRKNQLLHADVIIDPVSGGIIAQ